MENMDIKKKSSNGILQKMEITTPQTKTTLDFKEGALESMVVYGQGAYQDQHYVLQFEKDGLFCCRNGDADHIPTQDLKKNYCWWVTFPGPGPRKNLFVARIDLKQGVFAGMEMFATNDQNEDNLIGLITIADGRLVPVKGHERSVSIQEDPGLKGGSVPSCIWNAKKTADLLR